MKSISSLLTIFVILGTSSGFTPVAFSPRSVTSLRSETTNYEAELKQIEEDAKKRMEDKVNELKSKIDKEEN
ncbi:hypothetical protein TrRE_jg3554 [Triparma retinervis]|uniref:Uncharacterized protein n=1 Tax=Triparma retinervis TaxID=2557542 RepID=A0A9W7FBJ6_9STRA|nr:hypothetical protein TrRE_jg3554 [Triparma retinervis]